MKRRKILLALIIGFALLGIAASVQSVIAHYDPSASEFCSINDTFDCDIVNTSKWSTLFGIPVGVFGAVSYGFMLVATLMYMKTDDEFTLDAVMGVSILGFLFSLYLTYIEAFVLKVWCLVCVTSQLSILIIMVSAIVLRTTRKPAPSFKSIHE